MNDPQGRSRKRTTFQVDFTPRTCVLKRQESEDWLVLWNLQSSSSRARRPYVLKPICGLSTDLKVPRVFRGGIASRFFPIPCNKAPLFGVFRFGDRGGLTVRAARCSSGLPQEVGHLFSGTLPRVPYGTKSPRYGWPALQRRDFLAYLFAAWA